MNGISSERRTQLVRTATFIVLTLVLLLAGSSGAAAQDAGDDGLDVVATTTYRVRAEENAVDIEVVMKATNTVRDVLSNGIRDETFFAGVGVLIPGDAVDIEASRDGSAVAVTLVEEPVGGIAVYEVDFGPNLFYRDTAEVTLTYRLPSSAPRSGGLARANDAYVSILPLPTGDPGQASLRIELPASFYIDWVGADFEELIEGDAHVLLAENIDDPFAWFALVTGRFDEGLVEAEIAVDLDPPGAEDVVVASWPDDPLWERFISEGVTEGLPVLEDLTGLEWPIEGQLRITEAITPYLYGYAGYFVESGETDAVIEVGEDLDSQVLHHELAHAWFNHSGIVNRWLIEGLAEEYSHLALEAQGLDPGRSYPPDPSVDYAFALNDWPVPYGQDAGRTEAFGYAASHTVVGALVEEIGVDAMRETLSVLDARINPYDDARELTTGATRIDWRYFLDAIELVGGSTAAEALLREWVIRDGNDPRLPAREAARDSLARLTDQGGTWHPPVAFVGAMGRWDFGTADRLGQRIERILNTRDHVWDRATHLGLALPVEGEEAYENATTDDDFDVVVASLDTQAAALADYERARQAVAGGTGWVGTIGLWGKDPDADLEEVAAAVERGEYRRVMVASAELVDVVEGADNAGLLRVLLLGVVLAGALTLIGAATSRRRRRRQSRRRSQRALAWSAGVAGHREETGPPNHPSVDRTAADASGVDHHREPRP